MHLLQLTGWYQLFCKMNATAAQTTTPLHTAQSPIPTSTYPIITESRNRPPAQPSTPATTPSLSLDKQQNPYSKEVQFEYYSN